MTSLQLGAVASGLVFGLSLIVAIGPQNAFVLRQGIRRSHVPTVVAICATSDVLLIAAGTAGGSVLLAHRAWAIDLARAGGALFVLAYAGLAARQALRPALATPSPAAGERRAAHAGTVVATLAFTWLNPWVYLDTVALLGSVANSRPGQQWWFAVGASAGSVAWFVLLGFGGRLLEPVFSRPRAWRVLEAFIAAVMLATCVRLALGV
ncbi:MAG: LysE/ArgO family amino acid transporter [Actinomycetota bacterium]|nr:LysE/ArgO family amino acid transporter [Actinomycetota bacterium]